jgi:tripartite-type tricarboxylate transporter receptor subunit TctC
MRQLQRALRSGALAASVLVCASAAQAQAQAQDYPTRPVKLVVPFGPGGPTDVAARLVSQIAQSELGASTPAAARDLMMSESRRWADVVRKAGISPE